MIGKLRKEKREKICRLYIVKFLSSLLNSFSIALGFYSCIPGSFPRTLIISSRILKFNSCILKFVSRTLGSSSHTLTFTSCIVRFVSNIVKTLSITLKCFTSETVIAINTLIFSSRRLKFVSRRLKFVSPTLGSFPRILKLWYGVYRVGGMGDGVWG